jgi:hypothetical protein
VALVLALLLAAPLTYVVWRVAATVVGLVV